MSEYLRPIQATITRCGGTYLPAFIVHDAHHLTTERETSEGERYRQHIKAAYSDLYH